MRNVRNEVSLHLVEFDGARRDGGVLTFQARDFEDQAEDEGDRHEH
jgi:hypothetical protein